ncbi:hypothetical protein TSYNTROOL_19470 [Tepidanaerobacter syntrophicus]|uniref:hypothetical protein n=1 Tax=Tepidanaerobacter syntrophicus TaxID=224999 RepID=UPI0022EDBF93|nr:hypothetical protein [Tepidanaerobacter syntrophicus]GLI51861.1 hypothetical protein TSYNTROOL_19470 [Tepidanaerobacter syntrophicus]
MSNDMSNLIQEAMRQLKTLCLAEETLKSYSIRVLDPITKFYMDRYSSNFQKTLMEELKVECQQQYEQRIILQSTLSFRLRDVNILVEIHETGLFEWKIFSHKKQIVFINFFDKIISDFTLTFGCSQKIKQNYQSIVQRLITYIVDRDMQDFSGIDSTLILDFMLSRKYAPYILSDKELTVIFYASDHKKYDRDSPRQHLIMPVL